MHLRLGLTALAVGSPAGRDVAFVARPFSSAFNALESSLPAIRHIFYHSPRTVYVPWSMRSTGIRLLDLFRGPPTVTLAVPLVVVDPVKTQTSRLVAHVTPEIDEVLKPFVANRDATTTVCGKMRVLGVCTSLTHLFPNTVRLALVLPVFEIERAVMAVLALGRYAISKMPSPYELLFSALSTLANPAGCASRGVGATVQDNPVANSGTTHVFEYSHSLRFPCGMFSTNYIMEAV